MIDTNDDMNAYTEVYNIIKKLKTEDYKKIPSNDIVFFEKNMNNNYKFIYNESKELAEQELLPKTKEILAVIFYKYLATEKQLQKIDLYNKTKMQEIEKEKQEKYSYENLFKKRDMENYNKNEKNLSIVEYKKDTIIKKLLRFFNKFFR